MKWPIAWLALVMMLLVSVSAVAAPVIIERNDGALSSADVAALASESARWPFALHVMAGDFGTRVEMQRAAHACIREPGFVCIAVEDNNGGFYCFYIFVCIERIFKHKSGKERVGFLHHVRHAVVGCLEYEHFGKIVCRQHCCKR